MPQQHCDLVVGEREHLSRQVLLVRALTEDPEVLEPLANAKRRPAVAIAADEQLGPVSYTIVACYPASEHLGCRADRGTAFLGGSRVAQRLVNRVASVANEMRQEHHPVIRAPRRA